MGAQPKQSQTPRIPRDTAPFPYPVVALSPSSLSSEPRDCGRLRRRVSCLRPSRGFSALLYRAFPLLFFSHSASIRRLEKSKRRKSYCPCERKICNLIVRYTNIADYSMRNCTVNVTKVSLKYIVDKAEPSE